MATIKEMSLIDRAKDFAMDIHSHQKRKASGDPYFIHPFRTFQIAKSFGLNKDQLVLAIIHDTYEDGTNRNYVEDQIKSKFGDKMLKLVKLLSHDKDVGYNDYLYSLYKLSPLAFDVKMCDMIDNLTDSPSNKQKIKYYEAIEYLLNKGIKIKNSFINRIKKITGN